MPVVLRIKGYRFFFYSADLDEPPHVHVAQSEREAKFWINPVAVARAGRFRANELREIERILKEHQYDLLAYWKQEQSKRDHHTSED
jgi:hypothetical protein